MSEEKNKKRPKSKITPFRAYRDDLEMPEIDPILRESIMQEADEIEARLNSDPNLAGISASDDMFDMIVGKLKADGHWEEDDADEELFDDSVDAEFDRLFGKSEEENNNTISKEYTEPEESVDLTPEAEEEIFSENEVTEEACDEADSVTGEKVEKAAEGELTKWYQEQPEEVLRLIERGRKAEQEEKENTRKKIRRKRFVKRAAATAAVFMVLFSVGFSTEASRGWILKMWDAAMEGFGFKAATDNVGDGVEARIKSEKEIQALDQIEKEMQIAVPDFVYLPEGMAFLGSEILDAGWEARMFFSYQDKICTVLMFNLREEGVTYYTLDTNAELIEEFTHFQGSKVEIWVNNNDMDIKSYVAEMDYNNCRYVINGILPLEEMKKIMEFLVVS